MKKILLAIVVVLSFSINSYAQSTGEYMNPVLEYQTGTWCQYCPCAHTIIDVMQSNYPTAIVIAYHGANNDPWITPSAGIRPLFGWTGYPEGTIGRKSGNLARSQWMAAMQLATYEVPKVTIAIRNHTYNAATKTVTCSVDLTARAHLDGDYSVNYVLTEGNITYSQTGNAGCPGASVYTHEHVVKGMMNGDMGQTVNTGSHWMMDQLYTKELSYVVPDGVVPANSHINIFVYKTGTNISTNYDIQQALSFELIPQSTGIGNNGSIVSEYKLEQNYPNPFNPVTNIQFELPKDGFVSLKVYDMLGTEVANAVNEFRKAGTHSVTFDGASLASGVYYYKLETNNFVETKKMMLLK